MCSIMFRPLILLSLFALIACQDPPNNCQFATTFNDPAFGCYNNELQGACGSMTGYCPPQFCSHQCADDLLLYYDCSMGSLPFCPPSGSSDFPVMGYTGENVLGADESSFQDYVESGNGVSYNDRQNQYKKWGEQTATDAFRAYAANATQLDDALSVLAAGSHREILAGFYADSRVKAAVAQGLDLLGDDYVPDTSAMPLTLVGGNSTVKLRGFFDWVKKAASTVVGAIKNAVGFVAKHPSTSWDIGCAVWDVFNFFADGDAAMCTSFKLPDLATANQAAGVGTNQAIGAKYDPICTSECQICLEYAVPGHGDTYCLWDDYKGKWPSDLYCLQGCPTSGVTRKLLGSATKETECWDLCKCGNGKVSC